MRRLQWPDLGAYSIDLRLRKGRRQNTLVATGAVEAHAEALVACGFDRSRHRPEWTSPAEGSASALLGRLRRGFDAVPATPCAVSDVFEPASVVVRSDAHPSATKASAPGPTDPGAQVSYTTLGEHRGRKRLWLEGLRLKAAGFEPQTAYQVIFDSDQGTVTLKVDPAGDRTVSGRRRKGRAEATPIIDLAAAELTDVFDEAERVRAVVAPGIIVFSLHHQAKARAERERRLRDEVASGELTEGTLCAGGGVSTLAISEGLERAGLGSRVEWIIDRDRRYLEVADANNKAIAPGTRMFEASLEEVEPCLLPKVSLVSVSLPCTGHSVAGKAKRKLQNAEQHPTDALAVVGMIRILDAVQPSVIISENVAQAQDSATYDLVRAWLKDNGYKIHERVLDGEDAGSLENRKRWWFVALSSGVAEGFDIKALPPQARQYRTLGEALEVLNADDPRWGKNTYLDEKAVRDKAAGKGFQRQFIDENSTQVPTVRRAYLKRGSSDPFVRRPDGQERLLTPKEHARVKGVDEQLVEGATLQVGHEVLGQSILGGHGRAVGEAAGRQLQDACGGDEDINDRAAAKPRRGPGL